MLIVIYLNEVNMKQKKTINNNTMTPAQFKSWIISALRWRSRFWKPKQEAISRARVRRGVYKCEECGTEWPLTLPPLPWRKRKRKNIQADHCEPIVPITGFTTYDDWIERCFVGAEQFQALCWDCHTTKTKKENELRRKTKKSK